MKILLMIYFFSIVSVQASLGNFLLVGVTTMKFKNQKYISFKDKGGREYKIPREILTSEQNSLSAKEQIILYKEIDQQKYLAFRESCNSFFAEEQKKKIPSKLKKLDKETSELPCL